MASFIMSQTRSQTAILSAENRVRQLTAELQKAQDLNVKLLREQDEYAEEYKNLLAQIASMKSDFAEQEMRLLEIEEERNKFKEIIERRTDDLDTYEEALNAISMHENSAALCDQLHKTLQLEADQSMKILKEELHDLKSQIIDLQNENIKLKNNKQDICIATAVKTTNKFKMTTKKQEKDCKTETLHRRTNTKKCSSERSTNKKQRSIDTQSNEPIPTSKLTIESNQESDQSKMCEELKCAMGTQVDETRTKIKTIVIASQNKSKKMLILCDTYGKALGEYIHINNNEYESVLSICKPDAPIKEIVNNLPSLTKNLTQGDDVIVIASDHHQYNIETVKYVQHLCACKKLKFQITTLPYLSSNKTTDEYNNQLIYKINYALYELSTHSTGMSVIDINYYYKKILTHKNIISKKFIKYIGQKIIHNSIFEFTHTYVNLIMLTNSARTKNNEFDTVTNFDTVCNADPFLDNPLVELVTT